MSTFPGSAPPVAPSSRSVILALVARIHPRPPGMRRRLQILGTSPRMTAVGGEDDGGEGDGGGWSASGRKTGSHFSWKRLLAFTRFRTENRFTLARSVILALVARIHPRPPGMRRRLQILGTSPRMTAVRVRMTTVGVRVRVKAVGVMAEAGALADGQPVPTFPGSAPPFPPSLAPSSSPLWRGSTHARRGCGAGCRSSGQARG